MFNSDGDIARACRLVGAETVPPDTSLLTPETAPEAIRADQRTAVAAAHAELKTLDPQALSDACDLPIWNVSRVLMALGLLRKSGPPTAATMRKRGNARQQRVVKWLAARDRPFTIAQIASGMKLTRAQVRQCVGWDSPQRGGGGETPFKRFVVGRDVKGALYGYQVKGFRLESVGV